MNNLHIFKSIHSVKLLLSFVLVAFLPFNANSVVVPFSSVVATLDANQGNGLNGFFYDSGTRMTSLVNADTFVMNNSPTSTFLSTLVDYPSGSANTISDGVSLSSFLGSDGGSLIGPSPSLSGSIFVFEGFIAISAEFDIDTSDTDIDVDFAVGSDDGFRLNIGGETITENPSEREFVFSMGLASFEVEGLYAVELLYYEDQTTTGVEWYSTITGGPDSGIPAGFAGIVPTAVLSTSLVPVPPSVWLFGSGLLGLVGIARRKKRS